MRRGVYVLLVLMALLHQDFWLWNDPTLVFGFLPAGLAYHAGYSILVAVVWAWVMRVAWPAEIEAFAEERGGPSAE